MDFLEKSRTGKNLLDPSKLKLMLVGNYELKFWKDKNKDKSGNVGKEPGKGKLHQVALKEEVLTYREGTIGAALWISAFGQNLLNFSINDL